MAELIINNRYKCKVIKIFSTYVLLKYEDIIGIVHISEISDWKVKNIHDFFKIDEEYFFQLIRKEKYREKDSYIFSYKVLNPKLLKKRNSIIVSDDGFEAVKKLVDSLLLE